MEIYWSCGPIYSGRKTGNVGGAWCEFLLVHSLADDMKSVYCTKSSFHVGYMSLEIGTFRKFSFDEDVFISD